MYTYTHCCRCCSSSRPTAIESSKSGLTASVSSSSSSSSSNCSDRKWLKTPSFLHFWLGNVLRATKACTFSTPGRHRDVQKWPEHAVIWTFLLKMCFAPQRRALFQHLNFQKSSEPHVFWNFLLPNVLHATTACTFSTSQLPKVVRDRRVLTLFTSCTKALTWGSFTSSYSKKK